MPGRLLFLDGLGCNPEGFKPRFLRWLGYDVFAPLLNDRDFDDSLRIAEAALREFAPDVIVGYSRGGGLALRLTDQVIPRLLIAPSLKYVPDRQGFAGRLIILHSATDDSLPLESVREHLLRADLRTAELRVVGEDHTMIDEPALASLIVALVELTGE